MKVHAMTFAGELHDFQQIARRAAAADFSGLVVTEAGRTAYLSCAAAALSGADLDLATGIAVAFPRSPMVTAATAWELAHPVARPTYVRFGNRTGLITSPSCDAFSASLIPSRGYVRERRSNGKRPCCQSSIIWGMKI